MVVEFGETIDPAIQQRAIALADALDAASPRGLVETVPTYRSTLIEYDPERTDPARLLSALPATDGSAGTDRARHWSVAVCLEGEMAEDLAELASRLAMPEEEVRARLLGSELRVGMYGFAPGFAYCYGLDPALAVPRRATPRPPMPVGSLIVAAGQAGFSPVSLPTGWYVAGRTPARLFDAEAAAAGLVPVPFGLGDRLSLRAVDVAAFEALRARPADAVVELDG